jgi:hypothetical protein
MYIFITEDLTHERQHIVQLSELRKKKHIHSCWALDGKIFYNEYESAKRRPV